MAFREGNPPRGSCRLVPRVLAAVLGMAVFAGGGALGAIIDSMDDATVWSQKSVDGAATLTVSTVTGQSGNAVEGAYDLKTGSYVQFGRKLETVDISSGDAITFLYKGSGSKNSIEVKLQDSGGDWFAKTIANVSDTAEWTRAVLRYSGTSPDFTFAFMEGSSGDSALNTRAIKKISIGVTKSAGGSGTLLLDELGVYQVAADTTQIVFDNFNDTTKTTNNLGANQRLVYDDASTSSFSFSYDTAAKPSDGDTASFKIIFTKGGTTKNAAWLPAFAVVDTTSSCTELVFDLKGDTGATLGIGLKGTDAQNTTQEDLVYLNSYLLGGVTDAWTRVRIPLTAFPNVSFRTNFQIWFATELKDGVTISLPTAATTSVWIDNLKIFRVPVPNAVLQTLDSFDAPVSASGWSKATGDDASLSFERATGQVGKAYELAYAFNSGTYAIIERKISINVQEVSAFSFLLKGTGGANNVEFKVKDGDGTTYYKVLTGAASTSGAWATYTIPYTQLSFFSAGTDNSLNLGEIAQIDFAITKSSGQSTGGTLAVDLLSYGAAPSISANVAAGGVVENLTVKGNPVSPNGDGIDDEVTFQFTLKESSVVTLNVYDLRGTLVRQIPGGTQAAGPQTLNWDVRDRAGRVCPNGLCVFQFEARSATSGGRSDIRNIIAVVR